jgi:hypothetical protein
LAGHAAKRVEATSSQGSLALRAFCVLALECSRAESGLAATSLGRSTHQGEDGAQRIAAHPIAFAERRRGGRRALEERLATAPARRQPHDVASTHPPDPAPAQRFDLAMERDLEPRIGDDDRRRPRRDQGAQQP